MFAPEFRKNVFILSLAFFTAGVIVYSDYSMLPFIFQAGYCSGMKVLRWSVFSFCDVISAQMFKILITLPLRAALCQPDAELFVQWTDVKRDYYGTNLQIVQLSGDWDRRILNNWLVWIVPLREYAPQKKFTVFIDNHLQITMAETCMIPVAAFVCEKAGRLPTIRALGALLTTASILLSE